MSAFNYAVKFFDYAKTKYPELEKFPAENRYAAMQAAIVVATLIQQERRSPQDAKSLYAAVASGFPPSARHRCVTAVQHLSAYMLKVERETLAPNTIPPLGSLAGSDDKQLTATLTQWLGGVIMDRWTLGEADKPTASAMGRSAWTSGVMIIRALNPK